MNSMVRERDTHVGRLFIEVTPGIRRALELLAEASITLLDEIDAPTDEIEADPDFEEYDDAEDDDPGEDNADAEPFLGRTVDDATHGDDADQDLVDPETSAGLPPPPYRSPEEEAAQRATFDPRLGLRPEIRADWWRHTNPIPPFPRDALGRPAIYIDDEMRRLRRELAAMAPKRKKKGHR